VSDEDKIIAARIMRDASDNNNRAADRIEESVRQMQMLFDPGYGGTVPRLLEELGKADRCELERENADLKTKLASNELILTGDELSALIEACNVASQHHARPPWPSHGHNAWTKLLGEECRRSKNTRKELE
jgi:hypothetical protein